MARLEIATILAVMLGASGEAAPPTYLPTATWPGPDAASSQAAWAAAPGHQPYRLEAWPKNADGTVAQCWKTNVLYDTTMGWAGKCLGLFKTEARDEESCKLTCSGDPRCPVWQFVATTPGQCWIGFGHACNARKGAAENIKIQGAQRLMRGDIRVLKDLVGFKVKNLANIGMIQEGAQGQALGISRCKAWCYSSIACNYWQYSNKDGCYVDAPMLSPNKEVPYPLTQADLTTAADIVAGAYIQHFCPPKPAPASGIWNTIAGKGNDAASSSGGSVPVWAWVLIIIGVLSAVLAGAAYFFFGPRGKRGIKKGGRALQSEDEYGHESDPMLFQGAPAANGGGFGAAPPSPSGSMYSAGRPASPARSPNIQMAAQTQPNMFAQMDQQSYGQSGHSGTYTSGSYAGSGQYQLPGTQMVGTQVMPATQILRPPTMSYNTGYPPGGRLM